MLIYNSSRYRIAKQGDSLIITRIDNLKQDIVKGNRARLLLSSMQDFAQAPVDDNTFENAVDIMCESVTQTLH